MKTSLTEKQTKACEYITKYFRNDPRSQVTEATADRAMSLIREHGLVAALEEAGRQYNACQKSLSEALRLRVDTSGWRNHVDFWADIQYVLSQAIRHLETKEN